MANRGLCMGRWHGEKREYAEREDGGGGGRAPVWKAASHLVKP